MPTRTRIVLLMHPKEYRHEKCTTGRLTCLNLDNSEIIQGMDFNDNQRVRGLIEDPGNYPVLLYPGKDAITIPGPLPALGGRQLVVFLIDATWRGARTIAHRNPSILRLPRIMIRPGAPSRFTIKRQPAPWCLSTIEATHELLLALEAAGLDVYPDKGRLIAAFDAMQDFQVQQIRTAAVSRHHKLRGTRVPL